MYLLGPVVLQFDVDELHLTCLMVHSPAASVQCPSDGGYAPLGPVSPQVTGVDGIVRPRLIGIQCKNPCNPRSLALNSDFLELL